MINLFFQKLCDCALALAPVMICIYFSSWQESGKQFCRTFEGAPQTWAQKSNLDYLSLDFNSASPSPVQKVCSKGITFVQFCTWRDFSYFLILLKTTFLWSSFQGKVLCVIYPILHAIIEEFIIEQLKNNWIIYYDPKRFHRTSKSISMNTCIIILALYIGDTC